MMLCKESGWYCQSYRLHNHEDIQVRTELNIKWIYPSIRYVEIEKLSDAIVTESFQVVAFDFRLITKLSVITQ